MKSKFQTIFSSGRKYLAAFLLLVSVSSFAAGPENVDEKIASHFSVQFKNAVNISWSVTDLYSQASFEWMNEKMNAYYDADGNFYCMSKEIEASELPANAQRTISEKFPESVITQAIQMNRSGNETAYYVSLENAKASIILEIAEDGKVSLFKKTTK